MDAFSASLMADKREIIFAPTVYKFQTFAQMAEEFKTQRAGRGADQRVHLHPPS